MSLAGTGPAAGEKTREPFVQLLTPAGARVPEPHYDGWLEDIDGSRLPISRSTDSIRRSSAPSGASSRWSTYS